MRKQFVSSLSLLLLLNFLVKPIWIFGIDLQVQNQVGVDAYGLYAALFSFTIMFNIVLDMGLSHYANRNMSQNPAGLAQSFVTLTSIKLVLAFVYIGIAVFVGYFLGYVTQAFGLLLLLAANQFLHSLITFFRSHLAGLQLFSQDAVMSIFDKILTITLCAAVLYGLVPGVPMSVQVFALLQTCSLAFAALVGFTLLYRKTLVFKINLNLTDVKLEIRNGLPYALLILLMGLYTRVDSIMLKQISGNFEAGIYAQAYRLLDAVNQPAYLFSVLLLPMFTSMLAKKEAVKELSQLAFSLLMVITVGLALASAFTATPLMFALYDNHPELSAPVFSWLIFSAIASGIAYVFGTLLTAKGNLGVLNKVAFTGFGLNALLNYLLIPTYGAYGAAVATVITQSLTALVQLYFAFRLVGFKYTWQYWLTLILFLALATLGAWLVAQTLSFSWFFKFVIILLTSGAMALALKLLPLKAAIDLIKNRLAKN